MDLYPWIKVVHVLLAIVAVGANATYSIWLARAARQPQHLGWALRGVRFLDNRVANPAYVGLGIAGVLMVLMGPWQFEAPWIAISIGLYVALVAIGVGLYTPTLAKQISVYQTDGPESPAFAKLSRRAIGLGVVLGVLAVTIVALMVLKPGT